MTTENTETKTPEQQVAEATALFSVDSTPAAEKDDAANTGTIAAEDAGNEGTEGETQESADESDDESSDESPQPKKKLTAAERVAQIKAATREMREAERALQATRAVRDEKPAKDEKAAASKEDGPPKPEDFEYGELDSRYIEAKVQYGVAQGLKSYEAKQAERAAQEAQQREIESYNKKADGFLALGKEKYPDSFAETVEMVRNQEIPMSRDMAKLILDTPEDGVHVLQHLASNPKEAQQVISKSPLEQAAYFGRISAKYTSSDGKSGQPAVKVTKAPAPVKGAKGSGAKTSTGEPPEFAQFEVR